MLYTRVLLLYLNWLFFRVKRQINKWTASLPNRTEYFRNGRRNCHCPGICLSTCLPGEVNGTWTPVSEEEYIRGPENHSGWGRIAAGTAGYTVYNRWSGSTKILVHGKPFLQRNNSETVKYTKIWVCAWSVSCTILCETWQMVCWLPVTRRNCMVASSNSQIPINDRYKRVQYRPTRGSCVSHGDYRLVMMRNHSPILVILNYLYHKDGAKQVIGYVRINHVCVRMSK